MSITADTQNTFLPRQLQKLIPYYVLILAVMVFYSNVYDNAFLYDDKYLILHNSYLRSWNSISAIFHTYVNSGAFRVGHFYRPLQNLLYLFIYQTFGESTFAFHLLNVSIHAANTCLVYALGIRLNFKPWSIFLAALIWALHPLQTEAVTYMSSTADTLYVFFCLLALVILLPDFAPRKFFCVMPIAILGLLIKETAIVLPVLVMTCIYLTSDKHLDPKIYLKTWPLWVVTISYLFIRFVFLPFSSNALLNIDPMSQVFATHISLRIYTFLSTIPYYLQLMIWPVGLHMDRNFAVRLDPWFPEVLLGLLLIIIGMLLIIRSRKEPRPVLSWGLMWLAAAHFPQTGLIVPVNALFLEHWMYLPSIGLSLGIAESLGTHIASVKAKYVIGIVALASALVLGYLTYQQNKIWFEPITFYKNILDRGETSERAHTNLGVAYMENGEYAKAMEQYQITLKDHDLTPETHQNIAALLSKNYDGQLHVQQEIDELNRALEINPNFLPAHEGLVDLYIYLGDQGKAAFHRQKADEIKKGFRPQ